MKKNAETYARIINDVIMRKEDAPAGRELTLGPDAGTFVTSGGRLKMSGWIVSTVVRATAKSVSFSVQLPGGRGGYRTDILTRFVDEEAIREYAEHALVQILEINNYLIAD